MGCGRIGSKPLPKDLQSAKHALALALASGINFFDTADGYGRGLSEFLIGRVIARRSDDAIIATKCGILKTPAAVLRAASSQFAARRVSSSQRLGYWPIVHDRRSYEPQYVRRAAAASLRRLRRGHIDLFLLHSPPPDVLTREDVVETLDALKTAGTIRYWGVSVHRPQDAFLALGLTGIDAIEIQLNLCSTDSLPAVSEAARRGVGVIARQPFSSGTIDAKRRSSPAQPQGEPLGQRQVLATCLQFAAQTEGVASVIAGMTRPEHVAANVAAIAEFASADEISRVQAAVCGA
jgi:aryl-alcohol dehydrogenase-like predicted oxidoreductase